MKRMSNRAEGGGFARGSLLRGAYKAAHAIWRLLPVETRRRAFLRVAGLACPRPSPSAELRPGAVTVAGFLHSTTSLGDGARLCLAALCESGYHARFIDIGPSFEQWDYPSAQFPGLPAEPGGGALIIHANPHMLPLAYLSIGRRMLAGKYIIGYFTWELSAIPRTWQKLLDLVHEVWVPSEFCKKSFAPYTHKPVHVVPHPMAIDSRLTLRQGAKRITRERFGIPEGAFTVLSMQHMGSTLSRKNTIGIIRAFKEAFDRSRDKLLVLKLADIKQWPNAWSRISAEIAGAPNIMLMNGKLSTEEIAGLIACSDTVLSLHRAEGFGMVPAEAMLLGKPVIATGWSGNLDFMTNENSILINYTLVPAIDDEAYIYVDPNLLWAEPDIMEAAGWLRRLASNPDLCRVIGERAKREVTRALSRERYALAVRERLARHYASERNAASRPAKRYIAGSA